MATTQTSPHGPKSIAANAAQLKADLRYRSIAESAVDAIISTGADGRIYGWNPAATRIFGWTAKEALGMPLAALMPKEARAQHLQEVALFLKTRKSNIVGRTVDLVGLRKNGEEFPCEISISSWLDGNDRYFTSMIRDVTLRKQAEERIGRMNRDFRNLVDHIPRPILVSREGSIVFANQIFTAWYGAKTPNELKGRILTSFMVDQTDRAQIPDRLARIQEGEIVPEKYWLVRLADGRLRTIATSSVPVDFEGAPSVVTIMLDITDRLAETASKG